jgi:hypothetical protein
MKILNTIARELFGLFVDDGSLALAILALLGTIAVLMHGALMDKGLAAIALVAGSILILIENVVRTAR